MEEKIVNYILEAGGFNDSTNWERPGIPALMEQVDAIASDGSLRLKTAREVGRYLAQGGQWAVYTASAKRDLLEVFGVTGDWERYCEEVGRAVDRLYKEGAKK